MNWTHISGDDMSSIDTARELARKKVYRDSLKRMQEKTAQQRQALGAMGADEKMIRRADLRLAEISNQITRENDAIFRMEQELGITPGGETGV